MTRAQALVRSLEPGRAAAFLLVEHLWAGPLVDAAFAAGGALISDDFLTGEVGLAVGSEVTVLEEASAVIAEAQAAEAEAELRAVAASAGAAEAEAAAEQIQAAAAADAVGALIAAGLVEEAATQQAVTALAAAGLITGAAAEAASAATVGAALTIAAADQAVDQAVTEDAALIGAADEVTRRGNRGSSGPRPGRVDHPVRGRDTALPARASTVLHHRRQDGHLPVRGQGARRASRSAARRAQPDRGRQPGP